MDDKVYVVTRWYEHDGIINTCYQDKETALSEAKRMALEDHKYFEYDEKDFEKNCWLWEEPSKNNIFGTELWCYETKDISISVREHTLY